MFYRFPDFISYNYSLYLFKAGSIIHAHIYPPLILSVLFCFGITLYSCKKNHKKTALT